MALPVQQLIPVLQTSIGPTIIISGAGLLLLAMTNRLGRTIDRARAIGRQLARPEESSRLDRTKSQLRILWRRACLLRTAIWLASFSALTAAFLIILIFVTALLGSAPGWLIGGVFIVSMVCLIGSLTAFILDVHQSLTALKLELETTGLTNDYRGETSPAPNTSAD